MNARPEPRATAPAEPRQQREVADRPATRRDLGALARHLEAQHAKGMSSLDERLSELEAAANRVEGRLFVELEPLVDGAVARGLQNVRPARRTALPAFLLLILGVILGAYYGGPVRDFGQAAAAAIIATFVPEREHSAVNFSE